MDSLQHYIGCHVLWDALNNALHKTRFQFPCVGIPDDPFVRLCLSNPSDNNFVNLIVIMNSYHFLKNDHQAICYSLIKKREFEALDKEIYDVVYANLFKTRAFFQKMSDDPIGSVVEEEKSTPSPIAAQTDITEESEKTPSSTLPSEAEDLRRINTFRRNVSSSSSMLQGFAHIPTQSIVLSARKAQDNVPPSIEERDNDSPPHV